MSQALRLPQRCWRMRILLDKCRSWATMMRRTPTITSLMISSKSEKKSSKTVMPKSNLTPDLDLSWHYQIELLLITQLKVIYLKMSSFIWWSESIEIMNFEITINYKLEEILAISYSRSINFLQMIYLKLLMMMENKNFKLLCRSISMTVISQNKMVIKSLQWNG